MDKYNNLTQKHLINFLFVGKKSGIIF